MPNFEWKGIKNSQYVTGTMRALTRDEALFKLKEDGVIITMLSKKANEEEEVEVVFVDGLFKMYKC